ncbi:hypothetical protein [Lacrimispora sp. 38-1]|uniref:hypothetical protein n=1 Tax=Lacrimispora sp. 38-1 TaxID=3125778 RepID=UPI003CF3228B
MPTNKPKVQIILDEDIYIKLKEIAEKDKRSISQMGGIIIEKYVEEYETQHKKEERKHELGQSSNSRTG